MSGLPQSCTSEIDVNSCGLTIIKQTKRYNSTSNLSLDDELYVGKIKKINKKNIYNHKAGRGIIDDNEFNLNTDNSDEKTDNSVISELSKLDSYQTSSTYSSSSLLSSTSSSSSSTCTTSSSSLSSTSSSSSSLFSSTSSSSSSIYSSDPKPTYFGVIWIFNDKYEDFILRHVHYDRSNIKICTL